MTAVASAKHLPRECSVGTGAVTDIDIVPNKRPVRPNHWGLTLQERQNRMRDDPTLIEVAWAEEVSAPGDSYVESERMSVGMAD